MTRQCRSDPQTLLNFWFGEIRPAQWFRKDPDFDRLLERRFGELQRAACACELHHWRATAQGRLAEILLLDQISRNLYRDTARAYAADAQALTLAQEAVAAGADLALAPEQRSFLYMPYMHSESRYIHSLALELFRGDGLAESLKHERRHKAIIDRFGRYPHRNAILGRDSSAEELEFLTQPGSSF